MDKPVKEYPTVGACGLDCGLCTKFYTAGPSRCPGCCGPDFFSKHPSCSFITCCVEKRGFETCGECPDFPCPKFKSQEEYEARGLPGYPPDGKIIPNLNFIKEEGIREFVRLQQKRIRLLQKMIEDFDDGRSRRLFCTSAALLDLGRLEGSLREANQRMKADADRKGRATLLKQLLNEEAANQGINLMIKARPRRS
jgi:hypothetical protein